MEKKKELNSLNAKLPPLYLEELEERLETDPLAIGGLLSSANFDAEDCVGQCGCNGECNGHCSCNDQCIGQCGCNAQCNEYKS